VHRVILMLALLVGGCGGVASPRATEGVLDLRGYDFAAGALTIRGDWLFNWEELVAPDANPPADGVLPLRRWNGLKLFDGRALPGKGYATYRLRVLLPDAPQPISVMLDPVIDACRMWATTSDGRRVGPIGSGEVGATRATSHGAMVRSQLTIPAGGELLLTLQVSNFEHARGGSAGTSPLIGSAAAVDSFLAHQRMADFFFIGLLVITGLHHLVLFALRRRELAALWFAAMCLTLALRLFLLGRYLGELPAIWPGVPHRLESLTFFLAVPAAALFLNALFPRDVPRVIVSTLVAISLFCAATVVLLPKWIYSVFITPYQVVTLAMIAVGVFGVIRAALRERDAPPFLMLAGLLSIGMTAILDIMRERSIIHIRFIAQYGITGFVIFQSALLALLNQRRAKQLAQRNDEVLRLNSELQQLNEELRRQIANRSHELAQAVLMMAQASNQTLAPGDVVADRYRIIAPLGEGGMGTVFRAERIDDSKPVALKLIRGGAAPEMLARFAREAEVVAKIDHPNVVGIYDFNVSNAGLFYLVMELVEGRSLEAERPRFGDVPWALPLVAQLARALAAIHAREVIHRDVKPSNLLVADGRLKLADFGVAQMQKQRPSGSSEVDTLAGGAASEEVTSETVQLDLTRAGMMIGSPMYMAPELAEGSEHGSTRSDMFCFGLVAYELLAGRRAWPRPLVMALMEGLSMPDPEPLGKLVPAIDPKLAQLIHACLHISPAERPDAVELQAVLEAVPVPAPADSTPGA
jgi:Protein kinase domain/7TM diverse intracellular signalling